MKALKIVSPMFGVSIVDTNNTVDNEAALLRPDPREVAVLNGPTNVLQFDLGSPKIIDTIFLGYNTFGDDAYVDFVTISNTQGVGSAYTGYSGDLSLTVTPVAANPNLRHGVIQLANPMVGQQFYLRIKGAGNLGVVAVGNSFTARWGTEWSAGRPLLDTSTVERLPSGGFGIDPGQIVGGYQWTFGDLQDSERISLYRIIRSVGTHKPILVIEDPDFSYDALAAGANVSITGSGKIITKTGSGSLYDASAYSNPRAGSIGATFKVGNTPGGVFGLSAAPATSSSFTDITYGVNLAGTGIQRYYNGVNSAVISSGVAVGDRIGVFYNERQFYILQNGVVIDAIAASPGLSFGFDCSIVTSGSHIDDVNVFGHGYEDRVHWGLFNKLDPYERLAPADTKWGLSLSDWA